VEPWADYDYYAFPLQRGNQMSTLRESESGPRPQRVRSPRLSTLFLVLGSAIGVGVGVFASSLWANRTAEPKITPVVHRVPPSAEEEAARFRQQRVRANDSHSKDPRDETWAPRAEKALRLRFEGFAHSLEYRLQRVDCRSHSCLVVFRWPSSEKARSFSGGLMSAQIPLNCASLMALAEVPDRCNAKLCEGDLFLTECHRRPEEGDL
jgi:hypothetical protein